MECTKLKRLPVLAGFLVAAMGIAVTVTLGQIALSRYRLDTRAIVVQQLGTVRAAVERSLNKRLYLTLGLRAHVSTHPNIDSDQFATFAAALAAEGDGIRSVTLIKDNVISDVFPREGNEAALGIDLLENPKQRDDVTRAIQSRQPWLSAPIKLVQGGEALVNRAPVFITPHGGEPGSGRYWGLVSLLINKDVLLDEIIRDVPDDLSLAIRQRPSESSDFVYVYGDRSIESGQPLTLEVNLPTGDWEVLGTPLGGWPRHAPVSLAVWWLGSFLSFATGGLTFLLLQSNSNYRLARGDAEAAVTQLSLKNEDLEAFVRTASHDLQSPIRHIRYFSEVLAEDAEMRLIDEDLEQIGRINAASMRMSMLIESLLRFARTGASGIRPVNFSSREAAEIVVGQLPVDQQSQVEFGDLPKIRADQALITQVFQNLIENGLRYHEGMGAKVFIDSQSTPKEITISVSDNGIGMEEAQLERIFKPGIRGVAESAFAGSGFGLAICERIVKAHGGRIWAESTPGEGSTFYFSLPKTAVAET